MLKSPAFMTSLLAGLYATAAGAVPVPLDLNTWNQQGASANGVWTVSAGGTSVTQSINGDPTFFVSPGDFSNIAINGNFLVNASSDDDYMGFVFGYQSPLAGDPNDDYEFFLFDWKKSDQSEADGLASEGFNLSRVSGQVSGFSPFWAHDDATAPDADFDVIDTDYGPTRGWVAGVSYAFTLLYEDDRIRIDIAGGTGDFAGGETIFDISPADVPGLTEFAAGRFGFYNYSQSNVTYQGFTEDVLPPDDLPEPGMLGLLGLGLFGLVVARRNKFED